jgi:hypothetical protein
LRTTFRGNRAAAALAATLAVIAALAASTSMSASAMPAQLAIAGVSASHPCGAIAEPQHIDHVIWVWMENQPYNKLIGSKKAPYLNQLANRCGLATNYHNITHPSAPEYIAATSGFLGGKDDCTAKQCPDPHDSIFAQATRAGETWASYDESMVGNCVDGFHGNYDVNHNPAVYYTKLHDQCMKYDVPMGNLTRGALVDALRSDLPTFTFITPNLVHDTHNTTIPIGDRYLSALMPKILNSGYYKSGDTAVFLVWDEGEDGKSAHCAHNTTDIGCHVPAVVMSPSIDPGTKSAVLFNHYSLLKTAEELLDLPYLGHANTEKSMVKAFNLR